MPLLYRWRYLLVFIAALLLIVVQPILFGIRANQLIFDSFYTLLILAVLLLLFEEREHRVLAFFLAVPTLGLVWLTPFLNADYSQWMIFVGHVFAFCFFLFALWGIIKSLFTRKISSDAVFGAICGYLLLGILWTLVYTSVAIYVPQAFHFNLELSHSANSFSETRLLLNYFSFVTLTTVGYGDIVPTTTLTRTLAWLEAMSGQFYLAVLVAGLVGIIVSNASLKNSAGSDSTNADSLQIDATTSHKTPTKKK